ncbi:hypothetical protein H6G13_27170 [Pseudanabaena sp. FACHB-2040]|nr:hypothetical protein [Pseudanabaena sp. FACHB-2040]
MKWVMLIVLKVERKRHLSNEPLLQQPRLLYREPGYECIGFHPFREPVFSISKRAALSTTAYAPQFNLDCVGKQATECEAECGALSVAFEVLAHTRY